MLESKNLCEEVRRHENMQQDTFMSGTFVEGSNTKSDSLAIVEHQSYVK